MKTIIQFGFMLTAGGLFVTGVWFQNAYLLAIALSLAYLCVTLLRNRFTDTRQAMFDGASQSSGMKLDDKSLFFPFSNETGEFVLKSEEDFTFTQVGNVNYQVKKLNAYPIAKGKVKQYEIEDNYLQYIFVSRFALRFVTLLAFVLAGYFAYTADKYGYVVIPIAMFIYHFIFYYQIFASAKEIVNARYVNADREYLNELMRFYGATVVGLDNPEPITEIMPTGAVLVRFEDSADAPYYFVSFQERVYLEMSAEQLSIA